MRLHRTIAYFRRQQEPAVSRMRRVYACALQGGRLLWFVGKEESKGRA